MTHEEANQAFADKLFNLCPAKPALAAVQQPAVHLLHGSLDTVAGKAAIPYERSDNCMEVCAIGGCGCVWACGDRDKTVSEIEDAGFRAGQEPIA